MKELWSLKQNAESETALDMYIYGDVQGDGMDWWTGETIESETSAQHLKQELEKHKNTEQINIYINSYGGSVFEGTAIYNQLKRHPAHKTVYVDGFACSIASVIAMAGDEIVMPHNALMMVHNMSMYACGNAAELRKAADDLDVINEAGRAAYLQKAGDKLTAEMIEKMENEETWLTADDCIKYGLADRYADEDADMSNASQILQKANLNLEQRIKIQKSLSAQLSDLKKKPAQKPEPKQKEPTGIMQTLAGI